MGFSHLFLLDINIWIVSAKTGFCKQITTTPLTSNPQSHSKLNGSPFYSGAKLIGAQSASCSDDDDDLKKGSSHGSCASGGGSFWRGAFLALLATIVVCGTVAYLMETENQLRSLLDSHPLAHDFRTHVYAPVRQLVVETAGHFTHAWNIRGMELYSEFLEKLICRVLPNFTYLKLNGINWIDFKP